MADIDTLIFKIEVENKGEKVLGSFTKKLQDLKKHADAVIPTIVKMNEAILKIQSLEIAANSLQMLNDALKATSANIKEFADKVNIKLNLGDEIKVTEKHFHDFRTVVNQTATDTGQALGKIGEQAKTLGEKIKDALKSDVFAPFKSAINTLTEYFPTFSKIAVGAVGLIKNAFSGLIDIVLSVAGAVKQAFDKMSEIAIEAMTDIINVTRKFEAEFNKVEKILGAGKNLSEEYFDGLSTAIQDLSVNALKGQISAANLTEVIKAAALAGLSAQEDLLKFGEVVSKMAVSFDVAATSITDPILKIRTAFGASLEDIERLGSSISLLEKNFVTTGPEIIKVLQRMAGTGEIFGLKMTEAAALTAAAMDSGAQSASVAGTSISLIFQTMAKRSEDWASALSLNFADFSDAIENRPVQALQMVFEAFQKLNQEQGIQAATQALNAMGLSGSRNADVFLKMSANLEGVNRALALAKVGFEENTQLNIDFAKSQETLNAQWEQFQNLIDSIRLLLGKDVVDAITTLLSTDINPLIEQFRAWVKESNFLSEIWPGIITIIKEGFLALLEVGKAFIEEVGLASYFEEAGQNWDEIELKILMGIQAWRDKAIEFVKNLDWTEIHRQGQAALETIGTALLSIGKWLADIEGRQRDWNNIMEAGKSLAAGLGIAWETFLETMKELWSIIKPFGVYYIDTISKSVTLAEGLVLVIKGIGTALMGSPMEGLRMFGDGIKKVFSSAIQWVKNTIGTILDLGGALKGIIADLIGIDNVGVQNSTWPDMRDWVQKNIGEVGKLETMLVKMDEQLSNMKNYSMIGVDVLAANREKESLQRAKAQIETGLQRPKAWDADGSRSLSPNVGTLAPENGIRVPSLSINFNGTNVVNERSIDEFARVINNSLNRLNKEIISA